MEIKKTQNREACTLALIGRLDTVTASKLQDALTEAIASHTVVELDFAEVAYVSSAGLRVLLQGHKTAKTAGKTMALKNVSPEVVEVFDITGFSGILTFA